MDWWSWFLKTDWLDVADHVAAIITAIVAVWAWCQFGLRRMQNRKSLENYLKALSGNPRWATDQGQRSIVHLSAELRLTESEILECAFASESVEIIRVPDPTTGHASSLMLKFKATK